MNLYIVCNESIVYEEYALVLMLVLVPVQFHLLIFRLVLHVH
jgi:hypothetical protein